MDKIKLITRCNELALNGAGFVSPNPLVGAILANEKGDIVAEGWHKKHGDVHAEINCLQNAKLNSINSFEKLTLAINLEPCTHFGKQPPCVEAIIEAKIPNVIIGMKDPNPLVEGKGIERLRSAGINVEVGFLEEDCKWVNRFFCHYITTGMPYITLKVAQSIDGFIAPTEQIFHSKTESKFSHRYITCEESRHRTHFMRAEMDATLVGINTILIDNPSLDCRLNFDKEIPNNTIIVLDSSLKTPPNSRIFTTNSRIFIIHSDEIDIGENAIKQKIGDLESAGAILIASPCKDKSDTIHLRKLLSRLCLEFNITSILVEGGGKVFSSFANSDLINELQLFVAPVIMGNGKKAFCDVNTDNLSNIKQLRIAGSFQSGIDEQIILLGR